LSNNEDKFNIFDEALQRADKILASNDKDALAWAEKGLISLIKRNLDKALECATKASSLDPTLSSPYFARGAVFYEKDNYEDAIQSMKKYLETPATSAESTITHDLDLKRYANECLAFAYFSIEKFNDAIRRFQTLLGSKPNATYLTYLGEIAEITKSTSPKEFYESALKLAPNDAHAMANLGRLLVLSGTNTEQGFNMVQKALEINSHDASVHLARADSLSHTKNYKEAVSAYEKALELPMLLSTRKHALHRKAVAHAKLHQFAEEHESLRAMYECHLKYCDSVTAYQLNIALQMADQDYDKLLPYLDQLIGRYPKDTAQLLLTRANVLLLKGQVDEARKLFAANMEQGQDEALLQFATCKMICSFAKLGQLQHIPHLIEPTIKWLKKNENKNYVLLAELLADIGQFNEALKYADLAIESLLTNTDTPSLDRGQGHRVKAAILVLSQDVDGAIESYERALAINAHEQQSMERLARLYVRQSRAEDALKLIDRLLAKRPNDPQVIQIKQDALKLK
jgi:tetratricopeptide (TPR) repeat protein